MKQGVACLVSLFLLLASTAAFAADQKIYTNKDLEKYTGRKDQEVPVVYTGRRVTLDFKNSNLTGVLSVLSDIARQDGYTLTIDRRIQGRITVKMKNVAWDKVLDFIVQEHRLVKTVNGKSITISPVQ
jgi:type II secretory pathway component HofQ